MLAVALWAVALGFCVGTQAQHNSKPVMYICEGKCFRSDFKITDDGFTEGFYRPVKCPTDFGKFQVEELK